MNHLLVRGDSRRLPIADRSVHCVVTSPPYFGLRDYQTGAWSGGDAGCDHVAKEIVSGMNGTTQNSCRPGRTPPANIQYRDVCGKCGARRVDRQIGLEPTPAEFVAAMVQVFREVRRVMRPDGCAFLNLGDSFGPGKQLLMIPHRVALALQADGWIVRSDIVWHKNNPMPESVDDRPTKSHEYVFLLAKNERYFFDADAVKEAAVRPGDIQTFGGAKARNGTIDAGDPRFRDGSEQWGRTIQSGLNGRNIRSVWTIATEAYPGSHFATFPRKLVEPCVKAGASERGCCPRCGAPWTRVVERTPLREIAMGMDGDRPKTRARQAMGLASSKSALSASNSHNSSTPQGPIVKTTGWRPSCECVGRVETFESPGVDPVRVGFAPDPVPCTVLDPFNGSGTTGVVALALGRNYIGVDLSAEYLSQARQRIERPHKRIVRDTKRPTPLFDGAPQYDPLPGQTSFLDEVPS